MPVVPGQPLEAAGGPVRSCSRAGAARRPDPGKVLRLALLTRDFLLCADLDVNIQLESLVRRSAAPRGRALGPSGAP